MKTGAPWAMAIANATKMTKTFNAKLSNGCVQAATPACTIFAKLRWGNGWSRSLRLGR